MQLDGLNHLPTLGAVLADVRNGLALNTEKARVLASAIASFDCQCCDKTPVLRNFADGVQVDAGQLIAELRYLLTILGSDDPRGIRAAALAVWLAGEAVALVDRS